VTDVKRKVYLETLKPDRMRPLRDTVSICYVHADAVNINQLFGIDAGGEWSWSSPDGNIDAYVVESTSPTYAGAVTMNGKAIYESLAVSPDDVITVEFTYKTDDNSCLHGKEYKMVIILTPDIVN
jgi:hypothetical protein